MGIEGGPLDLSLRARPMPGMQSVAVQIVRERAHRGRDELL